MTLGQFAIVVGAKPKWVLNTAAALGRRVAYSEEEAKRLGLAKQIREVLGLPLERADGIAGEVLLRSYSPKAIVESKEGALKIVIDLERYFSDFAIRLSRARTHYAPRRRGRPPEDRGHRAAERAREYGIDVDLVRSHLRLTPAERLRRLDRDREFVTKLRGQASGSPAQ